MLSKRQRISAALLKKIRPERTIRKEWCLIRFFTAPHPLGRCAVVLSKSVIHKASLRNKIRRLIYEWMRTHDPLHDRYNALFLVSAFPKQPLRDNIEQTFSELFTKLL